MSVLTNIMSQHILSVKTMAVSGSKSVFRFLRGLLAHGNRVRALARDRNLACRKNRQLPERRKNTRTRTRLLRAQRTQFELGEQAVQLSPVRRGRRRSVIPAAPRAGFRSGGSRNSSGGTTALRCAPSPLVT